MDHLGQDSAAAKVHKKRMSEKNGAKRSNHWPGHVP